MNYQGLMQLANGYAHSKVLLTANELGVFTALGQTKRTAKTISRMCRTRLEGMQLLLNALAGLDLIHVRKGLYWNTDLARTFLDKNSPRAVTNLLWLLNHHWSNWTEMLRSIQKGRPGWAPVTKTIEFRRRFALAMHERSLILAPLTIRTCRMPPRATSFFDLAGGPGSYSIALAKRYRTLSGVMIDQSIAVARRLIQQESLENRLSVRRGNIFSVPFPEESDAAIVANIFHDYDERENRQLLHRVRKALRPGGKVFIVEFFLDDTGSKPVDAAVFSLLMYGFTDTGRSYGWKEVEGWLKAEGFGQFRRHAVTESIGTLEAIRI